MSIFNHTIVRRNKNHLQNLFINCSIADYYQILPLSGSLSFEIDLSMSGQYIFRVKYKNKYMPKFYFPNLPHEMNRIVYSYLCDYIVLDFLVDLRFNFPFSPPIWSLKHVEHSFHHRLPISIVDYYNYILDNHNNRYAINNNWTASLGTKTDILLFICRINHFEIFSDY
jgi:hypothetical protein